MTTPIDECPHCQAAVRVIRERRAVPLGSRAVTIDDERTACDGCGEEYYTAEQADLRQERALAAARAEDRLLAPAEIRSIRESLGLSQRMFERLLGVGEKTCVRWETGRVCQNVSTDRLIRVVASHPEVVATLAAFNGVSAELVSYH